MNNKKIGTAFEQEWIDHLKSLGMWAHFMNPAADGSQPFDVLAIDNKYGEPLVYAYDCKTLKGNRFPLSRVEDNQVMAFKSLSEHGVHNTYFVVKTDAAIHLIPSQEVLCYKEAGEKSILLGDTYVYMRIE
jgi:Holliday junction resolvase